MIGVEEQEAMVLDERGIRLILFGEIFRESELLIARNFGMRGSRDHQQDK